MLLDSFLMTHSGTWTDTGPDLRPEVNNGPEVCEGKLVPGFIIKPRGT